jgi:hypothetical protein
MSQFNPLLMMEATFKSSSIQLTILQRHGFSLVFGMGAQKVASIPLSTRITIVLILPSLQKL